MSLREHPARTSHRAAANRLNDLKYALKSADPVHLSFANPLGNAFIPAQAGIHVASPENPMSRTWIPAYAGTIACGESPHDTSSSGPRTKAGKFGSALNPEPCRLAPKAPEPELQTRGEGPPRFCRLRSTWRMIVYVRHNSAHTARSPVANGAQSSLCKSTYIAKSIPKNARGAPRQSWNVMWNHEDGGILGKSPLRGAPVFTKFEFFEFCIPLIPRALRKHLADTAQPTIEKTRENAPTLTSTGQNAFYLESITYAGERARTKAGMFFRVSKSRLNDKPTFTKRPKRECGLESAT